MFQHILAGINKKKLKYSIIYFIHFYTIWFAVSIGVMLTPYIDSKAVLFMMLLF